MKTAINDKIVMAGIMLLTGILLTGCAPILAEIGISCPDGSESSTYNSYDTSDSSIGKNYGREASNNSDSGRESKPFIGYRIGARTNWPIAKDFYVSSGLFLTAKGSRFEQSEFDIEEKTNLTYLDVPAKVHYEIGESGININAGVQPSFLLGAKNTFTISGNETVTKGTDSYNTLDIGAGIGVGYLFGSGMMINLGYDLGLTNIINTDEFGGIERKNRVLHLTVGYQFN